MANFEKIIQISCLISILHLSNISADDLLNLAEQKIILAIIDKLNIKNCILVEHTNSISINLGKFKFFTQRNIPSMYFTLAKLSHYFFQESYPDINTLIVLKVHNLKIFINYLEYLLMVNISFKKNYQQISFKIFLFLEYSKTPPLFY